MVEELEGLKRQSTRRMSKEQVEKMVWEAGFLIARMQLSRCFDLDFRDELFGNSSVSVRIFTVGVERYSVYKS